MADNEPKHEAQDHLLSNTAYNTLKHTAMIGLPALGTLYFTIAQIWGLPAGEEVVGTIVAVDAFLGLLLGYSTKTYNASEAKYDGQVDIVPNEDGETSSANASFSKMALAGKDEIVMKVNRL